MPCGTVGLCGISSRFQLLSPSLRQVPHVLLTRSPLSYFLFHPKTSEKVAPFDLHVLGAPPAFVLSQDQTLYKMVSKPDYSEFKSLYSSERNRLRPLNYLFFGIFFRAPIAPKRVPFKLRYCSVFKVLPHAPLRGSLFIISRHLRFVKLFF